MKYSKLHDSKREEKVFHAKNREAQIHDSKREALFL